MSSIIVEYENYRGNLMFDICPACGSELDDEGNCWVCGYSMHPCHDSDDYDYDDFAPQP